MQTLFQFPIYRRREDDNDGKKSGVEVVDFKMYVSSEEQVDRFLMEDCMLAIFVKILQNYR